ncbi:MAG: glucose-1-phosphate adenylyltransferase [Hyphomonadaceae bacterium]|nr:glucose-1-phosphate adenylyltransferase [Clostridia bacterium]
MQSKECIAMILAGGQGSRLGVLTKNLAKPAVPFGGKYRIIDFPLSNCANSNIDVVGVLTQYRPLILNSYIGIGSPWDLDQKDGGVAVLPPYQKQKNSSWYSGTANAIYQNIGFIDSYDPAYVVVLSGDHIYKMDYHEMLEFHKQKQADVSISVLEVSWDEASRFGIMNTAPDMRVKSFEEKPKMPKSNLASMGVYIFSWPVLRKYLIEDEHEPTSTNDFGKDIIPKMLNNQLKMFAYPFQGYWKDVGTIESLWEANMDLLAEKPELDLFDDDWRIYSYNPTEPPQYIAPNATIKSAMISEGCQVYGQVEKTVLFRGVYVAEGAIVKNSIIMPNVKIGKNAYIENTIIGEETIISDGCVIGSGHDQEGTPEITVIGENIMIPKNSKIEKNSVINIENGENSPISYNVS